MNKIHFLFLIGLLFLTGCAQGYVLTLNNGQHITAKHKPKYDRGFYYFKDSSGQQVAIFSGRVKEIAPANMVNEEQPKFVPVQSK